VSSNPAMMIPMVTKQPDIKAAHCHSSRHRDELGASTRCGCFGCIKTLAPSEIFRWIESEGTALCPFCGIDSVIGDASGYPVESEFLEKMEKYWFGIRTR
jgi:hypothetical protein